MDTHGLCFKGLSLALEQAWQCINGAVEYVHML